MNHKVLIAMSGGVDSSVAAALMMKKGDKCIGCTMKLLNQEDGAFSGEGACGSSDACQASDAIDLTGSAVRMNGRAEEAPAPGNPHACCSLDDVEDARSVARKLGMPYYVFNFAEDFGEKVIDRFVRIYQSGGTPNPCIDCNRYMKFEKLFRRARELGCDAVVTGHYARIRYEEESGRWQLLRSKNPDKDQTYVLYSMTQEQLAHTIFPLGEYPDKGEVRRMAEEYGFVNSHKPDSQDICFVRSGTYADFIERRTGRAAPHGAFVDEDGNVLGEHRGLIRYTIGQRRGLGLSLPAPLYVQRIDPQKNQVVLTPEDRLFSRRLIAEDFNWIWTSDWGKWESPAGEASGRMQSGREGTGQESADGKNAGREYAEPGRSGQEPPAGYTCLITAKPRYRAKEAPATARVLEGGKVEIIFHEPQRALTAGQAIVLYQGESVAGGGTICEVLTG